MGSYYYLVAQLPSLIYEQSPPMSSASFLELAGSFMKKKDLELFSQLALDADYTKTTGCGFIDKYRNWEFSMRQNLGVQRAIKLKREAPVETNFRYDAAAAASRAMDETSPLEGELILDKARWYVIDDLAGNDIFTRDYLYSYYLKLLLIERREAFNVDKGFSEYKSLYASILEKHNESKNVEESQGEHA